MRHAYLYAKQRSSVPCRHGVVSARRIQITVLALDVLPAHKLRRSYTRSSLTVANGLNGYPDHYLWVRNNGSAYGWIFATPSQLNDEAICQNVPAWPVSSYRPYPGSAAAVVPFFAFSGGFFV